MSPKATVTRLDDKTGFVVVQKDDGSIKTYTESGVPDLGTIKDEMGISRDTPCDYTGGESVTITPKKGS